MYCIPWVYSVTEDEWTLAFICFLPVSDIDSYIVLLLWLFGPLS